ncbi:hypothetical protein [Clostridium sp. UBA1652]|uniref:hypothetical protein n=1 Tax=Clostridium sp. UBA1652 TaxID=1946348 RepID=UPI0025799C22|nr:hypothetical protein [Clostridium sp. UBA1652]
MIKDRFRINGNRINGIDRNKVGRATLITIKDSKKKTNEELMEELIDNVDLLAEKLDESNQKMIDRLDKILKNMNKEAI